MAQRRGSSGARGTRAGAGKTAGAKRGAAGGRGAAKRGAAAKRGSAAAKRGGAAKKGAAKRAAPIPRRNTRTPDSYRGAVNLRGSDNYASKLREADVRKAKDAHDRGAGVRELASKYGVNPSTMSRALRGLTFQHVPTGGRARGAKRAGGGRAR